MGKGDNMIDKLPEELFEVVLGCLGQNEWSALRLVSKRWNHRCLPLLFKKVAIVKHNCTFSRDERSDAMFLAFYCSASKEMYGFRPLCYEQLKELPSEELRKVIQQSTSELFLFYDRKTLGSNDEEFYGLVSGLFKDAPVQHLAIWLEPGRDDEAFGAFQGLVDQFKPFAEFSLAINLSQADYRRGQVILDTEGMNISGLFFRTLNYHNRMPLPLWKVKGQEPANWSDLAHIFKDTTRLTLWRISDIFEANWPQSIKHLHVMNADGVSVAVSKRLVIPPEVEQLRITDILEFNWDRLSYRISIFYYLELKRIKHLKRFEYYGEGDVSDQLTAAILQVKDSLEHLGVFCRHLSEDSTFDFRDVAKAGLGVKTLDMNTGGLGRFLFAGQSRFDTFWPNFPELESLGLELREPTDEDVGDFFEDGVDDFVEKLLRAFVKACPKLECIEMTSTQEIAVFKEAAWAQRCASGADRVDYIIDVVKSRAHYC